MNETTGPIAIRIRDALERALMPQMLDVIDESHKHAGHAHVVSRAGTAGAPGETHFRIKVVAASFEGKTRLARHREINALLADEMGDNKVHAMAIEARAPGE
jgi:BolA protein